jgi:sugar phosphate isomerase/epimerase
MSESPPRLTLAINFWTLWGQPSPEREWTTEERVRAVKEAGFDAYCCPANTPGLAALLEETGLRFCGAFDAGSEEQFEPRIREILAIGDGPINCQLADHDTPVERAIELTLALMEEARKQNADVHLEMHRDTCTETPEKTYAIAEGFRKVTGHYPKINFDFSHPASIKHLDPSNYIGRLFENIGLFQASTLWHMRPFNGHHCQVPVTDGHGNFSPEYEDMRPFIRQALVYWLAGPRPGNELWVVPELGPKPGYGLSCFPNSWLDAIVLGNDIRKIWLEILAEAAHLES